MAGVRVVVDESFKKNAVDAVDFTVHARYNQRKGEIAEEFIQICTPFIPYKTGRLIDSGHVVNSGKDEVAVAWNASNKGFDYAREQYYHEHNHPIQGTDHWDKAAMAYSGDIFAKRCEDILNR